MKVCESLSVSPQVEANISNVRWTRVYICCWSTSEVNMGGFITIEYLILML
jgi:hypothetical protein